MSDLWSNLIELQLSSNALSKRIKQAKTIKECLLLDDESEKITNMMNELLIKFDHVRKREAYKIINQMKQELIGQANE